MKLIFRMAWRNIWRNRRRTIITMLSIVLAIVLSIIMRSMQLGSYGKMINDVVGTYTGHIQVHQKGYWNDKTINSTFAASDSLIGMIESVAGVAFVVPRLESFALAAGAERSRGSFVVGIAPEKEHALSGLRKRVIKGDYLTTGDSGALVAGGLARFLKLGVGDTIVLLGQGYHGVSAAGAFRIKGIVHFASPELDRSFVYLDLATAQALFSAEQRLTSAVVEPRGRAATETIARMLRSLLDGRTFEVLTWREMLPELVQQIQGDNVGGIIMLAILYLVVAFGIFGTILMMTNERIREFGIVNAVGFSCGRLAVMAAVETAMLSLLSALAGSALALPVVLYFNLHPIRLTGEAAKAMINFGVEPVLPFLLDWRLFLVQILIVIAVTAVTMLYPFSLLGTLKPVSAMRR
ncbi:MAG: ABC transporter permease [Chitinispirillaceae bacterium]|nr:ABC transporter permease [Chitinispirillaceae bacterium]